MPRVDRSNPNTQRGGKPEVKWDIDLSRKHPLLKGKKNIWMLVDGDIVLFHVTMSLLTEHFDRRTGEYSWTLNHDDAMDAFADRVEGLAAWMGAKRIFVAWTTGKSFRTRFHTAYKAHRSLKKPLGYYALRKALHDDDRWESHMQAGLEADDWLGLWATKPGPQTAVICTDDKDLDTVPGLHLRFKGDKGLYSVSQNEAAAFHLEQTLTGDPGDGYQGLKGVGPVRARGILAPHDPRSTDAWAAVVEAYGGDERTALRNARCAFILQHGYLNETNGEVTLWQPPGTKGGGPTAGTGAKGTARGAGKRGTPSRKRTSSSGTRTSKRGGNRKA